MTDADMEMREDLYEEAFARMKKAAGVSDIDEVVRRFETQEETTNHLLELQVIFLLRDSNANFPLDFFFCRPERRKKFVTWEPSRRNWRLSGNWSSLWVRKKTLN